MVQVVEMLKFNMELILLLLCSSITSLSKHVQRIGIPYRWLQSICGLQFLSVQEKPKPTPTDPRVCVTNLDVTVRKLRRRIRGRVALYKQLAACG